MTTPIVYYGGKSSMLDYLLPLIPPHEVYTETFFGGGAVFFAKKKVPNETINDKMGIVVNFYRTLKRNYKPLKNLIDETLYSRELFEKARLIMKHQEWFSDLEKAWAFWLVSNFSYANKIGGGLKFSNAKSATPSGSLKKKKEEFTELLLSRIEHANIECSDALFVLKKRDCKDSFHFIDPPYFGFDQGHYRGWKEEHELALLERLATLKGKFILTNGPSKGILAAIETNGWWSKQFKIKNAGMRTDNRPRIEVICANFTPVGMHTLPFND